LSRGGGKLGARRTPPQGRCVMFSPPTWHGTPGEMEQLTTAVSGNCTCPPTIGPSGPCAAHRLLFEDQRVLDRLLFARNIAERLRGEEFQLVK
jgi:hypothetical protein